nr:gag protein [Human immunodeficiency virus 1]
MGARASVLSGGELDRWEKIRLRPGGKKKYRLKHIVWASRELERFAVNPSLLETSGGCRQILGQLQPSLLQGTFHWGFPGRRGLGGTGEWRALRCCI